MPGLCLAGSPRPAELQGSQHGWNWLFLKTGLFCVGCMQWVVEMKGGREFFDVENGARWVIV